MKKIAVYTSITNGYDNLKKIKVKRKHRKNIDFYYFKETREKNDFGWLYLKYPEYLDCYNPIERNRFVKMHPHIFFKDYEISLYIDGNMQIIGDIEENIVNNESSLISMFKHTSRNCIYDEAIACVELKKQNPSEIFYHMEKLKKEGYPAHHGLNEGNIILRKHNDLILIKAMEDWWKEFSNYSKRDQLSLNYVLWKHNISVNSLGDTYRKFEKLFKYPHGISRYTENKIYYRYYTKNKLIRYYNFFKKMISNNNNN